MEANIFTQCILYASHSAEEKDFLLDDGLHFAEQAADLESPREQVAPTLEVPALELSPETVKRPKYKLRLGYDPRIFLEDPRMRGQQVGLKLSEAQLVTTTDCA